MKTYTGNSFAIRLALIALAAGLLFVQTATAASWVTNAPMNFARRAQTATLLADGKVLVAGGEGTSGYLASAEIYDPATGAWQVTGSMTNVRAFHTATRLLNGKVLVAGGVGLASAELYNPASGTWTNTGSLHTARYQCTATLLPDGTVLVAGGNNAVGDSTPTAEVYDSATGTWTQVGLMGSAHWRHTAALLPNGKVLVAGGGALTNSNFTVLSSAELYNPGTATWTNTASLNTARFDHISTLLPNGTVLISGGFDNADSLSSTEFYNPVAGTWTNGTASTIARDTPAATLLQNGKFLVTGGYGNGNAYLSSTELYNPNLAVWTTNGAMSSPRWQHTATLLASGKVLVTGGYDGASLLASTELYDPAPVSGPTAPILTGATRLTNGSFQFTFTSSAGASFTTLATTNLSLPLSNWTVLGNVPETSPGQFQFNDPQATNSPQRFYRVRSP